MAAALKINSTSPISLKEMSGTDYEYAVDKILNIFAGSNTGVGTLSVNPVSNTGLTSIGTFTDTYYNATPGQHPIGTTVISSTYTFYQDLQSASESITRPVEFNSGVKEQDDTNLNADLISTALANLVAIGVGSYALQPTSPVGGTWVNMATITNTLDATTTNNTYLWRKTAAASSPSVVRPIKINTGSPPSLKEMSDAEIESLAARFRNRIVASGVGQYKVQSSAPAGGTWTTTGLQFVDTTRTQSDLSYTGTYVGTYIGTYSGSFTGSYTGAYTTAFTGAYTGVYSRAFTGVYAGNYTGLYGSFNGFGGTSQTFTGFYTGFYTGSFTGIYAGTYGGTFTGVYAGTFTGAFTGSYTGSYTGAYSGITLNNDSSNVSSIYLWVRTA